jgi:hypothetical protein
MVVIASDCQPEGALTMEQLLAELVHVADGIVIGPMSYC